MLERIKTALVQSFAGAIAIGLLLSQGVAQIVRVVINPLTVWLQQRQYADVYSGGVSHPMPPLESVLPPVLMSVFQLLVAYGLLRWLYFPPTEMPVQDETIEQE